MKLPRFFDFFKNVASGHTGHVAGADTVRAALHDRISDAVDSYGALCTNIGREQNVEAKGILCHALAQDVLVSTMEVQAMAMRQDQHLFDNDVLDVIDFLATSGRALEGIAAHFDAQNPLVEDDFFIEAEAMTAKFREIETDMIDGRLGLLLYNTHRRGGVESLIEARQWPNVLSIKIRAFRDIPPMYEHNGTEHGR